MVILSEPLLVRQFIAGEDFFSSPVSWRNRQQMLYTADGVIKSRDFGGRRSMPLPFRAIVENPRTRSRTVIAERKLQIIDPSGQRLVIRGARLYDGIRGRYREHMDVLLEGGRIVAVEKSRDWQDATVLNLGNSTILPGFIDAWSAMPVGPIEQSGPRMLAYGVTSIVTDEPAPELVLWEGERSPGPRVLAAGDISASPPEGSEHGYFIVKVPAASSDDQATRDAVQMWQAHGVPVLAENWNTGIGLGADLFLGARSLPSSPVGGQYQDVQIVAQQQAVTLVSGFADAGTPGLSSLLDSRQARELGQVRMPLRRFATVPELAMTSSSIILGSRPNGLPPGLALHAELRALASAGLRGDRVLRAGGAGAAVVLGLEGQIGRIAPGAVADLVLVNGDPLNNAVDALSIVAVVRNGRFFSLVSLLERARATSGVE